MAASACATHCARWAVPALGITKAVQRFASSKARSSVWHMTMPLRAPKCHGFKASTRSQSATDSSNRPCRYRSVARRLIGSAHSGKSSMSWRSKGASPAAAGSSSTSFAS
eukprot:7388953-Prymnesium_polylepis.1